jgi:predicted TIM-barrel fold metal-dependent hydrolase
MDINGVLDCDTHFTDHLPEQWAEVGSELGLRELPAVVEVDGQVRLRLGGLVLPKPAGHGCGNPKGLGHLLGPGLDTDRAPFMVKNGITAAVLQPGFVGLSFHALADPEARTTLATGYNMLASRACAESALDLRWGVLLSLEDPSWSAAAVEHYSRAPHVVGAVVRPTARTERARLSDPAFDPVLEALAGAGLTLFVHGGTGCHQWSPLADAYADYTFTHAFGHMGEQMIALTDLLTRPSGLPEGLRIIMLESGIAWIPSVLERLALHYRRLGASARLPMEVFRTHVAVAPDPDERYALWACEQIGAGNVVFGSDYPHWDTLDAEEWFSTFGSLCAADVVARNTAQFIPRLAAPAGKGL